MYKQILLAKIVEYLKLQKWEYKKLGKVVMLKCPLCLKEPISANVKPFTNQVKCFNCQKDYNLLSIVRAIEPKYKEVSDEDIFHYLKDLLKVNVVTDTDNKNIETLFNKYEALGFDIVPVAKNDKKPIEKDWTNVTHTNKDEWMNWYIGGLNLGVKTGKRSNITVIDIDQKPIPEDIKSLIGKTLTQETQRGCHLFYKYEESLPTTSIVFEASCQKCDYLSTAKTKDKLSHQCPKCQSITNIRPIQIDILNDGKQSILAPSVVEGNKRPFLNDTEIISMPKELIDFLMKRISILATEKTYSEKVREDLADENFNLGIINEGEGRNNFLIHLGGLLRKDMNMGQVGNVLKLVNKHFCNPSLPDKDMGAMIGSLSKYTQFDLQELATKVLNYLKVIEEGSARAIKEAMGEKRGDSIDKVLKYLVQERYLGKRGSYYYLLKKIEWKEALINIGKPLHFEMPYFHDVGYFNTGDLILVGGKSKVGKTTIAMNIVKRLVKQGIVPHYISLETGSRFSNTALQLGLKEGDFKWARCSDPTKVELEENAITVLDWLMVVDKANTDSIFAHFVDQLDKHNGILIIMQQLKEDGKYFAENMVRQFPSLATRYLYEQDNDGTYGKFIIDAVREPKRGGKMFEIPCMYNYETKELLRIDEVKKEETGQTEESREVKDTDLI